VSCAGGGQPDDWFPPKSLPKKPDLAFLGALAGFPPLAPLAPLGDLPDRPVALALSSLEAPRWDPPRDDRPEDGRVKKSSDSCDPLPGPEVGLKPGGGANDSEWKASASFGKNDDVSW
jgi:hypothetical protein